MSLTLFVGGIRSGKSNMAKVQAECESEQRLFIAVCHPNDPEMAARIAEHRKSRDEGWITLEEPIDPLASLTGWLQHNPQFQGPIVFDSMGMWINNLMLLNLPPQTIIRRCQDLALAFSRMELSCSIVTDECGMGIVPNSAVTRKYVDILGAVNEITARHAQQVILAVCGIPLPIK